MASIVVMWILEGFYVVLGGLACYEKNYPALLYWTGALIINFAVMSFRNFR